MAKKELTPAEIGEQAARKDETEIRAAAITAGKAMAILHNHHLEVTDYDLQNGRLHAVELENLETFEKTWIRVKPITDLDRKANAPAGQYWSDELQQYVTIPKD